MQLRKNLNLYLSGIVVFTLTILLLSTAFALDESLGNRIAKIFWFYKVIIVAGIACIPLAWMRPFRFSITDLLVLLYADYTLCNDYFANEPLHLDHRHVFHIPTADNICPARFHARGTLAHRGNRSHMGTRPTIRFYPLPTQPFRTDRIILQPWSLFRISSCHTTVSFILHAYRLPDSPHLVGSDSRTSPARPTRHVKPRGLVSRHRGMRNCTR